MWPSSFGLLRSRRREHFPLQPDADVAGNHVGHLQLGSFADQGTGFVEGEVFGQDLEGIGHHCIRGQIDAGEQTLMHLVPVFLGERVGHIRADLNIELHMDGNYARAEQLCIDSFANFASTGFDFLFWLLRFTHGRTLARPFKGPG